MLSTLKRGALTVNWAILGESAAALRVRLSSSSATVNESPGFPCVRKAGKAPGIIFCHSLDSTWQSPIQRSVEQHATSRDHAFTRLQYRHVTDDSRPWSLLSWVEDLLTVLDDRAADGAPQMIVAQRVASLAAMQAAMARPEKVHSLVLLSPVVGLTLEDLLTRYFETFFPGSSAALRNGERIHYRGPKNDFNMSMDMATSVCDILKSDPLMNELYPRAIPVKCPVKIIHGMDNSFVPHANSQQLCERLAADKVQVLLLKGHGHSFGPIPEIRNTVDELLGYTAGQTRMTELLEYA